MRTTLTLEPDVEQYIREACLKRRTSFKQVVNDALRESLKPPARDNELLAPRAMGLAPGIDPRRLAELAGEMEADAYLAVEERRRSSPNK